MRSSLRFFVAHLIASYGLVLLLMVLGSALNGRLPTVGTLASGLLAPVLVPIWLVSLAASVLDPTRLYGPRVVMALSTWRCSGSRCGG